MTGTFYKVEGASARTFGYTEPALRLYTVIQHPNGSFGDVYNTDRFPKWSLGRWKAQFDVEEIPREDVPDEVVTLLSEVDELDL